MSYRFALLGCGRIGARHAAQIASHGNLLAVCDIDPEKAGRLAREYGAQSYHSFTELLHHQQPDLVSVCTPNGLHAPHAIEALEAGCHVLCEKPMSLSTASGQLMAETARRTGKKLFVVKQNRYNPPVMALKQLLVENKLGEILGFQLNCFWNRPPSYFANSWHGTMDLDGGILYTQFSHFIDLLYWLLGDTTVVSGFRQNTLHQGVIQFEDSGAAILQLSNGARGTLQYSINSHASNMEGSITVFGSKGTVKVGGQYLNELEHFSVEGMERPHLPVGNGANNYGHYQGSMSNHDKVYDQLIAALNDPNQYLLEAEEALHTIRLIEHIYQSSPLIP
ncbi:Gfo/Idh/MocA family protein [Pseudobacter ginsenosidimutans]|uniref:Putative dehydrogenase n=1 Tax=Pseudobacter ginsenosidimutans TaxID=661488 RepID=A0A4Q7N2G5_9BACT|nr:Gfo/Idh/MocA family oxidoreductase [Pseudobacter ginsenosidimutans]QEC44117.1 Gfo/Idh/MocA family oxidoreductase [Pseudobacter ginsenosidimutans]RZS75562.1 putative dehydrogenase [Pseudobacter ginsenosidimutans]